MSSGWSGGSSNISTQTYDVEGHLLSYSDPSDATKNRTYVTDIEGRVLSMTQGGKTQHYLVVNGTEMGTSGDNTADAKFDLTYTPIAPGALASTPQTYVVQSADETLESIAQAVWGDRELWYVIAYANGVSDGQLEVGLVLTLPQQPATAHNSATDFRPYNPAEVVGDTSPW